VPLLHEGVRSRTRDLREGVRHVARAAGRPQHVADRLVAVARGQVGEKRLAVAVREVARILELAEVREPVLAGRVPEPHRRVRVDGTERQVFRHAFDEPQRQARGRGNGREPTPPLPRDVVLKGVHQLVAEHMIRLREGPREGHHDPPLQGFGDAARALADVALDRVGLLEVGVARVHDEGLHAAQLVPQRRRVPGVPALRHPRDERRGGGLLRIEVDLEMLGAEQLEAERFVPNLVPPEVLCRRRRRDRRELQGGKSEHPGPTQPAGSEHTPRS